MFKLLKKIMCKFTICCNSKCSLNDTDGDGNIDEVVMDKEGKEFFKINL